MLQNLPGLGDAQQRNVSAGAAARRQRPPGTVHGLDMSAVAGVDSGRMLDGADNFFVGKHRSSVPALGGGRVKGEIVEQNIEQHHLLGALIPDLQPFAPCRTVQFVAGRDPQRLGGALKIEDRLSLRRLRHTLDFEVRDRAAGCADGNELIDDHGFKNVVPKNFVAQPAKALFVSARSHAQEVLASWPKANRRVPLASRRHRELAGRSPATHRLAMSDFDAVEKDPILLPIVVVIASEHEHDLLAACIGRQVKPSAKPSVAVVGDRIGRELNSAQVSQQQVFRSAPSTVCKLRQMKPALESLLLSGIARPLVRSKGEPPPWDFDAMLGS